MKTRTSRGWVLGMMLATATVASGLAQDALNPSPTTGSSNQTAAAASQPAVTPAASPVAPAVPGQTGAAPLPSSAYVSPWLHEVETLTQAGVDEGVVLSYIGNSAGTFNLTADQIISLKNRGISSRVINLMLQHDQELLSGRRPMTALPPPPLSPAVQAAFAARFPAASSTTTPPATAPASAPAPAETHVIAYDDTDVDWFLVEPDDVPTQPESAGPVRLPYPVKLNDPIIIFRLPSFALPYW